MLENYFGLIEATFVFGLAIAFYVWQMRDLRQYDRKDKDASNNTSDSEKNS